LSHKSGGDNSRSTGKKVSNDAASHSLFPGVPASTPFWKTFMVGDGEGIRGLESGSKSACVSALIQGGVIIEGDKERDRKSKSNKAPPDRTFRRWETGEVRMKQHPGSGHRRREGKLCCASGGPNLSRTRFKHSQCRVLSDSGESQSKELVRELTPHKKGEGTTNRQF